MDDTRANAHLIGGPEPVGGRHVHIDLDAPEVRAAVADGSVYAWVRVDMSEPTPDGGWLRIYRYAGRVSEPGTP
jgi:hypothetical protein